MWRKQLGQAVFLASLNVSLMSIIAVEIICFLIFRVNAYEIYAIDIPIVIGGILNSFLFDYVYVKKKRYEYITSDEYKPFNLNVTLGVAITFLIFVFCVIGCIGIPLVVDTLLSK
jgi:hypothetical protein